MSRKTSEVERLRQRAAELKSRVGDLTRTSKALRQTAALYAGLFEQSADAIVVFDPATLAMVEFNDEACRRLGYSRREFAKLKLSDLELIESAEELKRHARKVPRNRIEVFETKQRTKRGVLLDVEIRTKAIRINGRTLIQGVWRDITARKRAEETLRKTQEQAERILNGITDLFVSFDRKHRYTNLNARAEAYLGVKKEEVLGKQPWEVFPQVKNGLFHKLYMKAVAAQTPIHAAPILSSVTGRWYESHFFPSEDGVSIYYKDVTERMQAEEALRQANEQLENRVLERTAKLRDLAAELTQAEHAERQRIALLLHEDLQQRLAAILYTMHNLKDSVQGDSALATADRTLHELAGAIELTRSLATRLVPPALYQLGLRPALEVLVKELKAHFSLSVRITGLRTFRLPSDAIRHFVFDAVRELLLNVFKHADVKSAEVRISHGGRKRITVEVRDKGKGIVNRKEPNDRFGLFSIRERAGAMGIDFDISSRPGQGTCVALSIPIL